MGRPRKFESAAELYEKGLEYIKEIQEKGDHLTFTGLCIALDTTRETLDDYFSGKYDDDYNKYSDSAKRLKQYCENYAEQRLFGNNPTGAIFALKNYGWKDKQEVEANIKADVSIDLPPNERQKRIDELLSKRSDK